MADRLVALLERNALWLHLLSLCIAAMVLLRVVRDQWFYADEWAFLSYTRDKLPWWDEFLTPHNGHLSTFPIIEFHGLRWLFGLQTYWPYIIALIAAHLVLAHLLWRVMLSVGSDRVIATVLAAAIAVVGAGWENLLWAFQIGFVGALALGLGAVLLANHSERSDLRDTGAIAAVLAALLFSGVGVVMCAAVSVVGVLRAGLWRGVVLGAPPTILYLAWRLRYPNGLYPEPSYGASGLHDYAASIGPYVVRGLSGAMDRFLFDVPGLGAVAILALAIFVVLRARQARTKAAPAYALAVVAVGFLALTGSTRLKLGNDQAASARYSYVVLALLAPLAAVALTRLCSTRSLWILVTSGIAIAVAAHNVQLLRQAAARDAGGKQGLRQTIMAGAAIARDRAQPVFPDAVPEPVFSGALTMSDLRRFSRQGDLPTVRPMSVASVLNAATYVQVALESRSDLNGGVSGCRTVAVGDAARLETTRRSGRVVVSSDGPAEFHVLLKDRATGITGAPRPLSLPGGSANLIVLRPFTVAYVGPQNRAIRVCRGAATR